MYFSSRVQSLAISNKKKIQHHLKNYEISFPKMLCSLIEIFELKREIKCGKQK